METSALVPGSTYYRPTFADPALTMPGLEPLVYVGKHDSEGSMLHTFQDTISYTWIGRYPGPYKPNEDMEVCVYPMQDKDAATMLSFAEMVAEINKIAARAEQLQFPVLKARRV